MSGRVVILRGIPGSGKTTYAAEHFPDDLTISSDSHFTQSDGSYRFDPKRLGRVHDACLREFRGWLFKRHPLIVVDKCNLTWLAIAPYARAARAARYGVLVVTLLADPTRCWSRNVHAVPREKVLELERILRSTPPLPSWVECETIWTDARTADGQ